MRGTKVNDAALEYAGRFSRLQSLNVSRTNVTDAGLEHLRGLTQLRGLDLYESNVTDAGVKKLQQALPDCGIHRVYR